MNEEKCEYCTGHDSKRKPLMKNSTGNYLVILNSCNYLEDSVVGNSVEYSLFGEKIRFCPMCGRPLTDRDIITEMITARKQEIKKGVNNHE